MHNCPNVLPLQRGIPRDPTPCIRGSGYRGVAVRFPGRSLGGFERCEHAVELQQCNSRASRLRRLRRQSAWKLALQATSLRTTSFHSVWCMVSPNMLCRLRHSNLTTKKHPSADRSLRPAQGRGLSCCRLCDHQLGSDFVVVGYRAKEADFRSRRRCHELQIRLYSP